MNNLFITLTIAIFVALIIPIVKKIAIHINALDIPDSRKIHSKPIPRLGGLGIFFGLLLGYMLFASQNTVMNSILIASFIILITGIIDDIKPIKARYKFIGQFVAACVIVFHGDVYLDHLTIFGLYIDLALLTIPLTLFFILGCINCINLIDGMDGLSSGISAIYFLTIGIIGQLIGGFDFQVILCFIMLGACLGFLVHNFNPAKIFAGDSGAMLLGLIISVVALLGFKAATLSSLLVPIIILAIPILDTIFAILRRGLKGVNVFSTPDKFHIHHQLLSRTLSQKVTVLIIYGINILFAINSILFSIGYHQESFIIYGFLSVIVIFFVLKTNVIFDFKKKKK